MSRLVSRKIKEKIAMEKYLLKGGNFYNVLGFTRILWFYFPIIKKKKRRAKKTWIVPIVLQLLLKNTKKNFLQRLNKNVKFIVFAKIQIETKTKKKKQIQVIHTPTSPLCQPSCLQYHSKINGEGDGSMGQSQSLGTPFFFFINWNFSAVRVFFLFFFLFSSEGGFNFFFK